MSMSKRLLYRISSVAASLVAVIAFTTGSTLRPTYAKGKTPVATPTPPAPTVSLQVDAKPAINILILVLDSLRLPSSRPAAAPKAATPAAAEPLKSGFISPAPDAGAPAAIVPTQPVAQPGAPAPSVRPEAKVIPPPQPPAPQQSGQQPSAPAAITPASAHQRIEVRAYAKKQDSKKEKEDLDKEFSLEPLPPVTFPPGSIVKTNPGPPNTATTSSAATPSTGDMSTDLASTAKPVSMAQSAAVALRRALVADGYKDVMTASLDSPVLQRPVNAGRLRPQVVDTAWESTSAIALALLNPASSAAGAGATGTPATPQPNDYGGARQPAIAAAARIGQTTGYRAVIVLAVTPESGAAAATANAAATVNKAGYTMLLVDTASETGDVVAFDATGTDEKAMHEDAATIGSALLDKSLRNWPEFSLGSRLLLSDKHLQNARELIAKGEQMAAEDELNQAFALNSSSADIYELLGDVQQKTNPADAAENYKRAAEIKVNDGNLWTKAAVAYTLQPTPDWVSSLNAANRAVKLHSDSALLELTMARAQFGRADAMRAADRPDLADDTEFDARRHLDKVMAMAGDNQELKDQASRLIVRQLLNQSRYREAVELLETLVHTYPNDLELMKQYATALTGIGKRDEDAFVAWARVWKLGKEGEVHLDASQYKKLANGFDLRVYNLAKQATQLASGVANGTVPQVKAYLQLQRFQEDIKEAADAIKIMQPPPSAVSNDIYQYRNFAAALMVQSLSLYEDYLNTGKDLSRIEALDGQRQAVNRLNQARNVRW
jgi:hypothetical protein